MGSVQYIDMRWKRRSLVIFLCPISWPVAVPLWDLKNSFRLQVFGFPERLIKFLISLYSGLEVAVNELPTIKLDIYNHRKVGLLLKKGMRCSIWKLPRKWQHLSSA